MSARPRPPAALAALLVLATLAPLSACRDTRATPEECARILDRMVEIELTRQGYRDPVLLERRRVELRGRYRAELDACVGRRLHEGAMECVDRADDIETLIHACLHHR
ncbi:MAG: hypothetical protein H6713_35750 [Myxococcales bacterium]|nr:hypothetical protein [Myxococcales bacterium]